MLVISWNVAGLSTTLAKIDADYSSASIETNADIPSSKRSRSHAFSHYLHRLNSPDVLCIQEHKIPLKALSSRSEPYGCSNVDGYESFWSCCVDKSKRGFNGVVTYAKSGTVRSADSRPLGDDELDDQGRCVMTDHGSFVIFNVYVPLGASSTLGYKMKFLRALKKAMDYQRTTHKKKVMLVGDLNIAHQLIDRHWTFRSVRVDHVIEQLKLNDDKSKQVGANETNGSGSASTIDGGDAGNMNCNNNPHLKVGVPSWKMQLAKSWNKIQNALSTIEAVATTTTNVSNNKTYDKFRAKVKVHERKILLGGHEASEAECLGCFCFSERKYIDEDSGQEKLSREANVVPLLTLAELMTKIAGVEWDTATLRRIANSNDGSLKNSTPTVDWLTGILTDDEMLDPFRFVHPSAQGRFTCWNQMTNRRYENMGTRIDYTLIDKSLARCIDKDGSQMLRCCNFSEKEFNSEQAALHAATASGMFQGASFEGGGIAAASTKALETQFGDAHTGIIYTAPQYSDHVAISLVLNSNFDSFHSTSLSLDGKDSSTKKAQPHKAQKSISSFFTSSSSSSSSSSAKSSAKRKPVGTAGTNKTKVSRSNKPKGTLLSHWKSK